MGGTGRGGPQIIRVWGEDGGVMGGPIGEKEEEIEEFNI